PLPRLLAAGRGGTAGGDARCDRLSRGSDAPAPLRGAPPSGRELSLRGDRRPARGGFRPRASGEIAGAGGFFEAMDGTRRSGFRTAPEDPARGRQGLVAGVVRGAG